LHINDEYTSEQTVIATRYTETSDAKWQQLCTTSSASDNSWSVSSIVFNTRPLHSSVGKLTAIKTHRDHRH